MQGSKAKYTQKQKRQAEHIAKGYRQKGLSPREAKRRGWATVNKSSGGGLKENGSGRKQSKKSLAKRRSSVAKSAVATKRGRSVASRRKAAASRAGTKTSRKASTRRTPIRRSTSAQRTHKRK